MYSRNGTDLDHELFNNTMETVTVVVSVARVDAEILHRLWTLLQQLLVVRQMFFTTLILQPNCTARFDGGLGWL